MKILYVEDSIKLADKVINFLKSYGHETYHLHYLKLINKISEKPLPDILLINSTSVTQENSQELYEFKENNPSIPMVLILTLLAEDFSVQSYYPLFTDYIFKDYLYAVIPYRLFLTHTRQKYIQENMEIYRINENCTFDYPKRKIFINQEIKIISSIEAIILQELCRHMGHLVNKQELIKKCWDKDDDLLGDHCRYLDRYMVNIRRYLNPDPTIRIDTFHKKGYCLTNM